MEIASQSILILVAGLVLGVLSHHHWEGRRRCRQRLALDAERARRRVRMLEILDHVFTELESEIRPGVTPADLAAFMEELAHRGGARSSVRNFRAFPAAACISVNDVFVNAIPSHVPIAAGDLVNVQFGVTDGCAYAHQGWAYSVGEPDTDQARLLRAGVEALVNATRVAQAGGVVGDLSSTIQAAALAHGCTPSHHFQGFGISEQPMEPPRIPCYSPSEEDSVRLKAGSILSIHATLHAGTAEIEVLDDAWSVRSKDGEPAVSMSRMVLLERDCATPLTKIRTTSLPGAARGSGDVA
jgi:methionyl aminopeptidase